jgi:hypothetical protein
MNDPTVRRVNDIKPDPPAGGGVLSFSEWSTIFSARSTAESFGSFAEKEHKRKALGSMSAQRT